LVKPKYRQGEDLTVTKKKKKPERRSWSGTLDMEFKQGKNIPRKVAGNMIFLLYFIAE
jgi:hypothetical protein